MPLTSSGITDTILLLTALVFFLYKYITRHYGYWEKRGVFHIPPIPIFGNFKELFLKRKTIGHCLQDVYRLTDEPYFGIYVLEKPYLVVKSPELIKQILVKDFNIFSGRTVATPDHNGLMKNFLFLQKNPDWKNLRAKMTQVFSTGKIKGMFPILNDVGHEFADYIKKNTGVMEAKQLIIKYSTEITARCFFGVHGHSFEKEDATFNEISKDMFASTLRNSFAHFSYFFRPEFVNWFGIEFVPKWIQDDLNQIFWSVMEQRKTSKVRVNDLVDILGDFIKDKAIKDISQEEKDVMIGNVLQFYAGGFETTSSTTSFALYEMATNPAIQIKLRNELKKNVEKNNGLTFDGINDIEYLSMVLTETLRKYPVLLFLDRRCEQDYQIPGRNMVIEKGSPIYIPVYALHMDEKYFPEPDSFIPERFADHKNYNQDGIVFLPFGGGPRICIGERFGSLSTRVALASILLNFEVKVCPKTPIPLELDPANFLIAAKGGLYLDFTPLSE